jgi:desampylase
MTLHISSELHAWLIDAAANSPDAEICGLLTGTTCVERLIPARNVADDPQRSFEIDPEALFSAIRAERRGEYRLLGYYHSHPSGDAFPSARDVEQATCDERVWLIIGANDVRGWTKTDEEGFAPVRLVVGD